jgi:hypothetical protein
MFHTNPLTLSISQKVIALGKITAHNRRVVPTRAVRVTCLQTRAKRSSPLEQAVITHWPKPISHHTRKARVILATLICTQTPKPKTLKRDTGE